MWSVNSTSVLTGAQFVVKAVSVVLYYILYVCLYVRFSWFNMTAEVRIINSNVHNTVCSVMNEFYSKIHILKGLPALVFFLLGDR